MLYFDKKKRPQDFSPSLISKENMTGAVHAAEFVLYDIF